MTRTIGYLKWWQWALVILWGATTVVHSAATSGAEQLGLAVGAFGGAYVFVLLITLLWRRGSAAAKARGETSETPN